MNDLNKLMKGDNLVVAVIFGFATFNFWNTVAGMLFGDWFNTGGAWSWSTLWTALAVYVVLILVAWWVNMSRS